MKTNENGDVTAYAKSRDGVHVDMAPVVLLPQKSLDYVGKTNVTDLWRQPVDVLNRCGFYLVEGGLPTLGRNDRIVSWRITGSKAVAEIERTERRKAQSSVDSQEKQEDGKTVYSKLKLCVAIAALGKWETFETWLNATKLNGLPLKVAFDQCQYLKSDNALFEQGKSAAAAALGVTGDVIEQILSSSVDTDD